MRKCACGLHGARMWEKARLGKIVAEGIDENIGQVRLIRGKTEK